MTRARSGAARTNQLLPDGVVKSQHIDIAGVILLLA
jgi:hypothetical protein